ncbi:hypothetical protein CEUSTIGMA_g2209.t1 [Chlamydomonas eustigma]|uniref:non-specific serine/threonine protein kinase n=1 Tax=Chlamydomonas eustigma TaxID=1157962 RepID=A0A250WVW0_9CHLO|nr:hypothetical protein CEUSTIGMA_g2209.t1 [Chlamydomonas eustigma]|eukprot:GAX74762.1 hypothetical protein CEUSTIGMA_g2209.t1 [Chlamydomonas eustigma]
MAGAEAVDAGADVVQENSVLSVPSIPGRLTEVYDVQKPVGKGGYAIVYKGIRKEDGRIVAVKKVEIFEMTQKKRERCLQEVSLLQQLSHPFIIQMYDAFIDENMLIIIFEWAPAGDLKRLIKKTAEAGKTLDEATIWKSFLQITDALRYMHQHRIMHRDIKPANVLVGANGALKIGDLGLGRQLSEQSMEAFSKVGTPYYVSPEVVRGAGYDWKSDVWSMGCLLYELACLRSPFEMEGANLYDVFQKISKGDYQPLPAGMFSAPLRSLVVRMLSVDPVKRPDLDEVWSITQGIVQAQSITRQDIYSSSEELFCQLSLLESDILYKMRKQNGKRIDIPAPPSSALRQLHPLFFAEPLVSPAAANAATEQKRQLGAVMAIFAWLLGLAGKSDLAQVVESQLELVPGPSWLRARHPTQPQPPSSIKRSTSGGSNKPRGTRISSAKTNTEGGGCGSTPDASLGSATSGTVPSCVNMLKGAEAMKKAAQAVGLSTEFAPVNALALGHGRAVCSMMQDLLGVAVSKVQPSARKPRYQEEAEVVDTEEGIDNDLDGRGEEAMLLHVPSASNGQSHEDYLSEEREEAYFNDLDRLHSSSMAGSSGRDLAGSRHPERGSGPGRPPVPSVTMGGSVDPMAWRAELERLLPQLCRIVIPVDGGGAAGWGDWHHRWHEFKAAASQVSSSAPDTTALLMKIRAGFDEELGRIASVEQRLNAGASSLVEEHKGSRKRLSDLQRHVGKQEDLLQSGNAALAEINARLDEVALNAQERAGTLDGGTQIQGIQVAIRRLKQEMSKMDLRIGVVQEQLLAKRTRCMQTLISVDEHLDE